MITQDLLSAVLGKPENNPELQKFFTQLGSVAQLSEFSSSYYLNYPNKGLSFSFNDLGYLMAIHIYVQPLEEYQAYLGTLPKNLSIHDTQKTVEEKLQASKDDYIKNHSFYPQLGISIDYIPNEGNKQESKIKRISFQVPRENTFFRKPEYCLQIQNLIVHPDQLTELISLAPTQTALKEETFRNGTQQHKGNFWELRITPETTYQQVKATQPTSLLGKWLTLYHIEYILDQLLPYQETFSRLTNGANSRIIIRELFLKSKAGFDLSSTQINKLVTLGLDIAYTKR